MKTPWLSRSSWLFVLPHLLAVLLLALAPIALQAQAIGGAITGTVIDASTGKYLEGAELSLKDTAFRVVSERGGTFTIRNVPAGTYSLVSSYTGLDPVTTSVKVNANETVTVPVSLKAGDVVALSEFHVTGAREGMSQAVALQKVSVQSKIIAASDQFGEISEGNVGEYLKFLPGISIDYNVNDARGISLRGLSTAWTVVAVDGTPMAGASSTDDTRRFEFEQIAMNNVETTEIYKSVTPDIAATATGGFVNFVTKSAFDIQDSQQITYDLSFSGPSTNFSSQKKGGVWGDKPQYTVRPSLDLDVSRKITDKIGVNINYRFSEKYDDSPRLIYGWVNATTAPTTITLPRLNAYTIQNEQKLTHREAFATKLDYKISNDTKLTLSGQWNWYDLPFTDRSEVFTLGSSSTVAGDIYTSGSSGASLGDNIAMREKYGTTMDFNGTLTHEFSEKSKLSLTGYWSRADSQYRDTSKGFMSGNTTAAVGTGKTVTSFKVIDDFEPGIIPTINLLGGPGITVPMDYARQLSNYTISNSGTSTAYQSRPWTAIDKKKGLGGSYSYTIESIDTTLQTGYAVDDVRRDINRPTFVGTVPATTGAALSALADPLFTGDLGRGFGSYQAVDPYLLYQKFGNPTTLTALDQRAITEINNAVYLRADVSVGPNLLLVGGARWERRTMDATARTGAPSRSRLTTADLKSDGLYPSLTLKYNPTKNLVFRTGYSRTVGIPDYGEILPSFLAQSTATSTDGTISVPSSNLKSYSVNNLDLSGDYYLKNSGVASVSLFHKEISDFIISRSMSDAEKSAYLADYGLSPTDFSNTTGTIRENGSKVKIDGFELNYQQNLTFLPQPFNGLNIQANYTYVDVRAEDSDPYRALDTKYSALRAVSPKTFNLVLGYRYGKWSTTITNNWVSKSLYGGFVNTNYVTGTANTTNPALDTRLLYMKDAKLTTDIKVEYSFNPRFSIYALVRNVFNSPRKEYFQGYLPQNSNVILPYRYFEFGEPHLTIGVQGRF